jgi:PAS domain S-box-containing protein
MPDNQETEAELLRELDTLRRRISKLEQDIANREQAEAEIAGLANFAAENPNPVLRISEDCTILCANRASSAVLQTWRSQVGQRLPEACCQRAKEAFTSGNVSRFEFTCDDGRIFLVTLAPMVKDGYLNAYGVDITERKKAEGQLRESEQRWRCLAENAPDVILTVDSNGTILFLNRTVPPYTPEEAIGTSVYDYVLPEYRETLRNAIEMVVQTGEPCSYELAGMGPSRRTSWYRSRLGPIKEDGKVVALTIIATDVTEHKQAEAALQESENKYRDLVEEMTDVIYTLDTEGEVTSVNKAAEAMLGRDPQEIIGKPFGDWIPADKLPDAMAVFERILAGGKLTAETVLLDRQGTPHDVEFSSTPITEDGIVVGTRGIIRDITARKKAEQKLKESEATLRSIIDSATESVLLMKLDGAVLTANKVAAERLGTTVGELVGKRAYDFLPPDVAEPRKLQIEKVVRTGKPVVFEDVSGKRHLLHSLNPVKDATGKVTKVAIFAFDMTEHKRLEDALRESELRYRSLFESSPVGLGLATLDGEILDFNSAMAVMTGYSTAELRHVNLKDIYVDPAERARLMERLRMSAVVRDFEVQLKRKDGTMYWANLTVIPFAFGGQNTILTAQVDITEQKKAQEALRQAEQKWRCLAENAPDIILTVKPDGTIVFMNRTVPPYTPEEASGTSVYDYVLPEYRDIMRHALEQVVQTGQPYSYELAGQGPDGRTSWYRSRVGPIKQGGQVVAVTLIATDVTEFKQAEDRLRQSEIKYRTLVENLTQKVFLKDKNSVYISCNENYARDLKIKPEDIVRKTDYDFYSKEMAEKYRADDRQIIESGQTTDIEEKYILPGREFIVHTVKTPVRDERGDVVAILGIFWDITESKRKERELNLYREKMGQAERLASLGTLSATIAHELTQPLTTIRLSIENSLVDLEKTSSPADAIEGLKDSLAEVSNVVSIVDRLRNFARESSEKTISEIELKAVAERVTHLLKKNAQQANVSLRLKGLEKLPPIYVHEQDMEQLFFALVENAIFAADGKKPRRLTISGAVKEEHIELQFADTCGGIAPENLNKIFEPFFTTKPAGEGTGLGLCVVHRVVSRAGGKVWVESRPGKGATFFVTLPVRKTCES